MSYLPALIALFLASTTTLTGAAAAEKRVYRIDSVAATREGDAISIQVKGAVQSGGWKKPRLRVTRTDASTLTVEFVAQPPESGDAVIIALLPVTAGLKVKAPHDALAVRALADANEVTAQILSGGH